MFSNEYSYNYKKHRLLTEAEIYQAGVEQEENKNLDPYHYCPSCGSSNVYGNGLGATELACPDCGYQYNPRNILQRNRKTISVVSQ